MFFEIVEALTDEDRRELAANGVPSSRVSEWKKRKGLPTRPQTLALATIKGIDFGELDQEVAYLETAREAERNDGFKSLLKRVRKL